MITVLVETKVAPIKAFFFLLIILLSSIGVSEAVYTFGDTIGFEQNSDGGSAVGSDGFDAIDQPTKIKISTTHARSGTRSARIEWNTGSTGPLGEWDHANISSIDGKEGWFQGYVRLGTAAENVSGADFSWNQDDTASSDVMKLFRFNKRVQSTSVSAGYSSIFVRVQNSDKGQPYAENERINAFGYNGNYDQNNNQTALSSNQWYKLNMYTKWSTSGAGVMKVWIDEVLVCNYTELTLLSSTDREWFRTVFGGSWNGGAPANQYMWIDDITIYDTDPSWSFQDGTGTPVDTDAPTITPLSPVDGDTGMPVLVEPKFRIADALSGVGTIRVNVEGALIADTDLTRTGNSTQYDYTIGSHLTSFSNDQVVTVDIGAADLALNQSLTLSYDFTITGAATVGDTFGTGNENNKINYTEKNANDWAVLDSEYRITNTNYEPDGLKLGNYAIYDLQKFSEWELEFEAKSDENLTTNTFADICAVGGWLNDNAYTFIMFNADANSVGIFEINDSARSDIRELGQSVITDNNYHNYKIVYQDLVLSVYIDEVWKYAAPRYILPNGKLGIGSYNDAVRFKNVRIKDLETNTSYALTDINYSNVELR